ncbi:MAG: hypothetical protein RIF33_06000 [Cyclobacteriaceae bacterium]
MANTFTLRAFTMTEWKSSSSHVIARRYDEAILISSSTAYTRVFNPQIDLKDRFLSSPAGKAGDDVSVV